MELLPGPGADRGPLPLGPRVATPHLFERLADLLVPTLSSADAGLAAHSASVGRDVPSDLDAAYAATAGVSEAIHAAQSGAQDTTTAPALIDRGAGTDQYRDQSLRYLPPPDTSIDIAFVDPPPPPGGDGGGDEGGGPPAI